MIGITRPTKILGAGMSLVAVFGAGMAFEALPGGNGVPKTPVACGAEVGIDVGGNSPTSQTFLVEATARQKEGGRGVRAAGYSAVTFVLVGERREVLRFRVADRSPTVAGALGQLTVSTGAAVDRGHLTEVPLRDGEVSQKLLTPGGSEDVIAITANIHGTPDNGHADVTVVCNEKFTT